MEDVLMQDDIYTTEFIEPSSCTNRNTYILAFYAQQKIPILRQRPL